MEELSDGIIPAVTDICNCCKPVVCCRWSVGVEVAIDNDGSSNGGAVGVKVATGSSDGGKTTKAVLGGGTGA